MPLRYCFVGDVCWGWLFLRCDDDGDAYTIRKGYPFLQNHPIPLDSPLTLHGFPLRDAFAGCVCCPSFSPIEVLGGNDGMRARIAPAPPGETCGAYSVSRLCLTALLSYAAVGCSQDQGETLWRYGQLVTSA